MSNFFEWIDSYSVGVADFDQDHKVMIKLANALILGINDRKGEEIAGEILVELIDSITRHFQREESMMKKTNYPAYKEHKVIHDKMIDDVFDFNDRYRKQELDMVDVSNFLIELIIMHISGEDKKYTEHFNNHGIS